MNAPGQPGISSTWSSSDKDTVGTAIGSSRVWYTIGHGILNEIYWPTCSAPQIRDLGFIVADEEGWYEVKRQHNYEITTIEPDIPVVRITHTHERYQLTLEIFSDPHRDVVLIGYQLKGKSHALKLYSLLAPHLGGSGRGNTARVVSEGLLATHHGISVLLAASGGFHRASAGYVGYSDGWQDFDQHGALSWEYTHAEEGNVALIGELNELEGVLALGFAVTPQGAATLAHSVLSSQYEAIRDYFVAGWQEWSSHFDYGGIPAPLEEAVRRAAMVMRVHHDTTFPGAFVASLSVPWGFSQDNAGGYHLFWPRDGVESAFAMLAWDHVPQARIMLSYLMATQQEDGHWVQNYTTDGRLYWGGVQLDETALPVLLAAKLDEMDELGGQREAVIRMVRKAMHFIAQQGPVSQQDRWEENEGVNPFTLGVLIAAMVAAARQGFITQTEADYILALADDWNARLEDWLYVSHTSLDHDHGIHGHYVRLAPKGSRAQQASVEVRNRGDFCMPARDLLGLEYLYLVRLGLRQPDDLRIRETTQLIDAVLTVDTPSGIYYHRYNEDGYGEHVDGAPFDGTGVGRGWPLLSGERGHYAVLAGEDATPYLDALLNSASKGGMLPEQVWDAAAIEQRGLYPGKPSGSAMPLLWAHSEMLKLIKVMHEHRPIELLASVASHFRDFTAPELTLWRESLHPTLDIRGDSVLIEGDAPFVLHFGMDGWNNVQELSSEPLAFDRYGVRIVLSQLGVRETLEFTRRFEGERGWEGQDWQLSRAA